MLRDTEIRKFQKEHMDDLFGVIRDNPSGMTCLTRFAREQLMDGDVLFFNDVEGKSQANTTNQQGVSKRFAAGTRAAVRPSG